MIRGDRGEGDGAGSWWGQLRLTVHGLRLLGQWPPPGREWQPGAWDAGYWGQRARPVLARLRDDPPSHGFYLQPHPGAFDDPEWLDWTALLILAEGDLVSGQRSDDGIGTLRLTAAGREALDPSPRDPLDDAASKLRSGASVDAVVTAVELGLVARMKAIAGRLRLNVTDSKGRLFSNTRINDELRKAGAYDETERAQVEAWLKLRNDVVHPAGKTVSHARVESLIAGIRSFLDDHPS